MRERRERQPLAVRRFHGILDQPHFHRPFLHLLRKVQFRTKILGHFRGEGNEFVLARSDIQAVNLSIIRVHDFFAAREKRITGIQIAREARLLIIPGDRILYPAVLTRLQIAQPQPAFRFMTRHVQQRGTIRRQHRPEAAPKLANQNVFVARLAVAPRHLP